MTTLEWPWRFVNPGERRNQSIAAASADSTPPPKRFVRVMSERTRPAAPEHRFPAGVGQGSIPSGHLPKLTGSVDAAALCAVEEPVFFGGRL